MNFCRIKNDICDFFACNKYYIIIFCVVFIVGFVFGIVNITELKTNFEISEISDIVLKESITGGVTFWAYFLRRFFNYLLALAFCLLLCLNFYSSIVQFLYILYRGYVLGSTIALCVSLLGVGGAICLIIIYIPIELALSFVLICFASNEFSSACMRHRTKSKICFNWQLILIFVVLLLVLSLCEAILLPPLIKSVIFVS